MIGLILKVFLFLLLFFFFYEKAIGQNGFFHVIECTLLVYLSENILLFYILNIQK